MTSHHSNKSESLLSGSTLIVPLVSIGNIPQLCVDLLIHSLKLENVETLDDLYLHPFASPVDCASQLEQPKGISTALEVYHSNKLQLCVIQQRSPVIPGFDKKFASDVILPFIRKHNFKKIVILDSNDAGMKEAVTGTIDVLSIDELLNRSFNTLKLSESKEPMNDAYQTPVLIDEITNLIKSQTSSTSSMAPEVVLLVSYVYEGDNTYDAENLARRTCEYLHTTCPEKLTMPLSWTGVYGDRPVPISMEEGIYG